MKNLKKFGVILMAIVFITLLLLVGGCKKVEAKTGGAFAYSKPNDFVLPEGVELKEYYENEDDTYAQFKYYVQNNEVVLFAVNAVKTSDSKEVIPEVFNVPSTVEGLPVTTLDVQAFSMSKKITKIILPNTIKTIKESAFEGCTALKEVNIPSMVKEIPDRAFYDCESLEKVTLPEGITTIGDHAFYECKLLSEIKLPETLTTIKDCAFYDCYKLKEITIPSKVTKIPEAAFKYCYALEKVVMPDTVTTIGNYAFEFCRNLKEIKLPSNLTSIGYAAFQCNESLEKIDIPEKVTSIGEYAFDSNYKLKDVKLPSTLKAIPSRAFAACTSLQSIILPDSIETIETGAFVQCEALTSIKIPEKVKTIGSSAFAATGLKEISIPASVESIGETTFAADTALEKVYWTKTGVVMNDNTFNECDLEKLTFYGYKDTLVERYADVQKIKFVYLDDTTSNPEDTTKELAEINIKDGNDKVNATVKAENTAKLKVEELSSKSETYKNMSKKLGNYKAVGAYEVSIISGKYTGDIKLTFAVDKKHEGKEAIILHQKADGTIEKFEDTVKNGQVEVATSELSPFIIAIKEPSSKLGALDNSPKTGDNNNILVATIISTITLGAIAVVKGKKD